MFDRLKRIAAGKYYWLVLIVLSISFEMVALFYQYILETMPCVLCIHVRILIAALLLVSVFGLIVRQQRLLNLLTHILTIITAAALVERSYMLLGTERGFVFSDCGFDLGLPSWLALDQWLPFMFRVEASCGYTPELLFGVTMAEALMVLSSLFLVVSLSLSVASLMRVGNK